MIIKKIKIKGFGKFKDKNIDFSPGVQVVYGPNEAGKSTLMELIKMMLYSRRKGASTSSEDKALRNKFLPWDKSSMCAVMEFSHEGSDYVLQKEIHESSVLKDVTVLQNLSSGQSVNLGKRQEVGEYLFALDLASFERSSFIEDLGKAGFENIKTSDDSILNKMLNLSQTGETEVCAVKVMTRLEEAMKEMERARGKSGRIPEIKSKIAGIKGEIQTLKDEEKENFELLEKSAEIKKLMAEKKEIESKLEAAENLRKIADIEKLVEKIKASEEKLKNIKTIEEKISELSDINTDLNLCRLSVKRQKEITEKLYCTEISEEETEKLSNFLKNEETLKDKLSEVRNAVNFKKSSDLKALSNNEEILDLAEKYEKKLEDSENFKNNFSVSSNDDLKKQSAFTKEKIILCVLCLAFAAMLFFAPAPVYLAVLALAALEAFRVFKIKSKIETEKKTKTAIEEDTAKTQSEAEGLKSEILNLIKTEEEKLEEKLQVQKQIINDFLESKNANSVKEFYENYAKFQNFSQNKFMLKNLEVKLGSLEKKFIEAAKSEDLNSANETLAELCAQKEEIIRQRNEISAMASALRVNGLGLKKLEEKLKNLKLKSADFSEENTEALAERLENLKILELENAYIEAMKKIKMPEKTLGDLNAELELEKENLVSASSYFESLKLAKNLIEKASVEIRKNFNPKLNKEASNIFSKLTGGKYENIYVGNNYGILAEYEMMQRNLENLSSGTVDQAYLSLRIAISKLICKNQVPLILDDTLVRYDLKRMENALEFFKNNGEIPQTIIFTCHDYIVKAAQAQGIHIIKI